MSCSWKGELKLRRHSSISIHCIPLCLGVSDTNRHQIESLGHTRRLLVTFTFSLFGISKTRWFPSKSASLPEILNESIRAPASFTIDDVVTEFAELQHLVLPSLTTVGRNFALSPKEGSSFESVVEIVGTLRKSSASYCHSLSIYVNTVQVSTDTLQSSTSTQKSTQTTFKDPVLQKHNDQSAFY
ncbi:hypothetical protein BD324DRAFT_350072 [Kockovaella imperatae]|uniref:Uncharacterized protein n=1 Tax=Kockovaella imperatae TaxID=4999 RepID=A0A1Y1ULB9_9TREE|nr:hypothetical protein BD324DRAFT_350072 [Kockovaella imperatae]ORX38347.1 hypothetical protein BD324DRAFT_350072 [Kockovaella imperatae]